MSVTYHFEYMDAFHKADFERMAQQDYHRDYEPKAVMVEGGIVLPYRKFAGESEAAGGVMDADQTYVSASAQHVVGEDMTHGYVPEALEQSEKKVIYFGPFHTHWGHFLTEMVTRCWYFCQTIDWNEWYVAYVRKSDTSERGMGGTYLEFLTLLGVPAERVLEVDKPTQFSCVIVPEISNNPGYYYTDAFVRIFDTIRDNVELDQPREKKIYFTRLKSKGMSNTQIGEKKICRLFEKNGYKIIAPEHFSLKEQIYMIKHCEDLVVIEGTLPHNILFANPGIRLTIINRVCGTNFYQPFINQVRGAEVTYVDAHLSFLPVFAGGPFLMYMSEELVRWAKDRGLTIQKEKENNFILHCKLVWYYLCYMDQMTSGCITRWNLREAFGDRVLVQYAFYRNKIKQYDEGLWPKLRKGVYLVIKGIVD